MQSPEAVLGNGKCEHLPLRKSEKHAAKDPPEQTMEMAIVGCRISEIHDVARLQASSKLSPSGALKYQSKALDPSRWPGNSLSILKSRHAVPGAGRNLNQLVIFNIRERHLCLYAFRGLAHSPKRTDLHLEQLVIVAERVAEQVSYMIRLLDATLRER